MSLGGRNVSLSRNLENLDPMSGEGTFSSDDNDEDLSDAPRIEVPSAILPTSVAPKQPIGNKQKEKRKMQSKTMKESFDPLDESRTGYLTERKGAKANKSYDIGNAGPHSPDSAFANNLLTGASSNDRNAAKKNVLPKGKKKEERQRKKDSAEHSPSRRKHEKRRRPSRRRKNKYSRRGSSSSSTTSSNTDDEDEDSDLSSRRLEELCTNVVTLIALAGSAYLIYRRFYPSAGKASEMRV